MSASEAAPAGKIRLTVTHLEMTARPRRPPARAPAAKLALLRVERPTVAYYRFLYNTVGEPWLWTDRRRTPDDRLRALLADPRTAVYVLYVAGSPAGFAELFRHSPDLTELAYFGLMPEFVGRRLGPFFLDAMIDIVWSDRTGRLIVQTCTLDHPKALPLYQRAGFVPVRRETLIRDDPRLAGIVPRHAAPHVPIVEG